MSDELLRLSFNRDERELLRVLQNDFDHYLHDEQTSNGYVDSRQVLVHYKNGEEIRRSEGGVRTYTPRFKELCYQALDKMFEEKNT